MRYSIASSLNPTNVHLGSITDGRLLETRSKKAKNYPITPCGWVEELSEKNTQCGSLCSLKGHPHRKLLGDGNNDPLSILKDSSVTIRGSLRRFGLSNQRARHLNKDSLI